MTPTGEVCHRIEGRIRIRVRERRGDAGYFAAVRSSLSGHTGIRRCEINALTGSVLVEHSLPLETLAGHAERAGLFRLAGLTPAIVPGRVLAQRNLRRLDQELTLATEGEVDLATLTLAGLLAMAAVQLIRGQVLAPAATLVWYALATMHFLSSADRGE
jgi:hypothetical protein